MFGFASSSRNASAQFQFHEKQEVWGGGAAITQDFCLLKLLLSNYLLRKKQVLESESYFLLKITCLKEKVAS